MRVRTTFLTRVSLPTVQEEIDSEFRRLGLDEVIACSPFTYARSPHGGGRSLNTFFIEEIVPEMVPYGTHHRLFMDEILLKNS